MSSPADLPSRTSDTQDVAGLHERVTRATSQHCTTSSLLHQFYTRGGKLVRRVPHRYVRHGFIALSIPAAILAGTLLPATQRTTATVTPVAASYALQGSLSAFVGDAAVDEAATADDFVFVEGTAALGAPLETRYVPVTADVANLRSGPGTDYSRISQLKQGTTVNLIGRADDWFQIKTKNGTTGWLHSEVLEVAAGVIDTLPVIKVAAPAAAPATAPTAKVGVTTDDAVNLRKGPSTSNGVIAKLPKGAQLEVLSQQGDWLKVSTAKGTVGWITASFFKAGTVAASSKASGPLMAAISDGSVNLRKGPNTAFGSFGKMGVGTRVEVLARNGSWYKVRSPRGTVGWVSQDLVDMSAALAKLVPITNDVPVLPKITPKPKAKPVPQDTPAAPSINASGDAASIALRFVGYRYRYGGSSPSGFDCSGLTSYVYRQLGINLPHKASAQYSTRYGQRVGMGDLQAGDLVFFAGTARGRGITHVALYVGGGMMVSANTPRTGVQYVSLNGSYWRSHFVGGLRLFR